MASIFEGSNAGSKPGLEIWRIENLKPVPVESESFGAFHTGDSYLILHTYEKANNLKYDLFYWQGEHTSQDEAGASAYRTVELDDYLGGKAVQHREVQGHESPLFMSLFPKGVRYLEGGVESGFRHVEPDSYQPRLFHIKGRRTVRCVQVELAATSLNDGDVFVLDNGLTLYQWNGESASRQEKFKALEMMTKIKDQERGGRAKLVFLESKDDTSDSAEFFKILKGSKSDVKSASEGGSDDAMKNEPASLWRISDASGSMEISEVARGKLERSMLDENDVFLLDGHGEVFIWTGRGATKEERAKGMSYGVEYLKKHGRPSWTPLTRLPGGGETPAFKAFFVHWDQEPGVGQKEEEYVAKERKIEMDGLLKQQKQAHDALLGEGKADVKVWRIDNLDRVEVDASHYGQFYAGDSYIILFKYKHKNMDSYVIYFWQGRNTSVDERAASALRVVELAGDMGDMNGTQVRVVQGKEPRSFLALFKGKMVVRLGNGKSGASSSSNGSQLFHIRGTDSIDTRAAEVPATAASLNSGDCFVLLAGGEAFVWQGKGSNADERATATNIAKEVLSQGKNVTEVSEGDESDTFWNALGGKSEYASASHLQDAPAEPRLFAISGVTGDFHAEEICNFNQDDLSQDGVFILDTVAEVNVWIGANAREEDKNAAVEMAVRYVQQAPDGRSPDTPIFRIDAGVEPPTFTAYFLGWNDAKAMDFEDPYMKKLKQLKGSDAAASSSSSSASDAKPGFVRTPSVTKVNPAAVAPAASTSSASASGAAAKADQTFTLAELKAGVAGIVASKKETYLSDAEFKEALGMEREAFYKLAGWKQQELKKKVGIF